MNKLSDNSTNLTTSIVIGASQKEVWRVVKNFGNISVFHPMVKHSVSTNGKTGIGAQRYCDLLPMGTMYEEITTYEEGKSFTAEVIGGKMLPPYKFMRGKIDLASAGNQTVVGFTFSYELKFGFLGRVMNAILIKPQFKKAPQEYVKGLKDYIESRESNLF